MVNDQSLGLRLGAELGILNTQKQIQADTEQRVERGDRYFHFQSDCLTNWARRAWAQSLMNARDWQLVI